MNKFWFRIRTMSKAPLLVPLRGPKAACGTAAAHPQDTSS
jgi:hypothetical protein